MTDHQPLACAALVAGLLAIGGPIASAQPDEDEEAGAIEEIVVTGSRIVRRDFNAPSPVTTVNREDLQISAQPTLEEALIRMPQVTPDFGRTSNNPGNGKSLINLRGLGAQRTLVMLNGRRLAAAGVGSSVDVNTLPQALIDRVEIITGGASTVYGSDAVAGVVNFITRNDFDGFGLETSAYVTEEGDSEVYDLNLTWGRAFAGDRGHATFFAGYLERKPTFAGDREISAVPLRDNFQGEVVQSGSFRAPAGVVAFPPVDLGNGPVNVTFTPDGNPVAFMVPDDLYNFAPLNYLQVPLTRYSGGLLVDFEFSGQLGAYLELTHTRNQGRQNLAPVPAGLTAFVNLGNPVLTPASRQVFEDFFFPAGDDRVGFILLRRLEELGPRIKDTTNDYSRLAAGVRGAINDDWDFDAWVTVTRGKEEDRLLNEASMSRFLQGLLVDPATGQCFDPSDGCVPVDPFGVGRLSPEATDFIRFAPVSSFTNRDQRLASAFIRGSPLDGWAGPISVALGIEVRQDSGDFAANEALATGDVLGFNPDSSVKGRETVAEFYVEGLIPLAENARFARYLALEVGGRLSGYDHAGNTETFKIGGEWEPMTDLRVRTMFQRSVRAPNLLEAFQEQQFLIIEPVQDSSDDPCSASRDPVASGNAERCMIQGIPADQLGVFEATPLLPATLINGGNPDLEPETAETWTLGAVYGGLEDLSLSFDYFDLKLEDVIGGAPVTSVCFDENNTENALCDAIRRDPANFNVVEIDARIRNLGDARTKGFDVQLDYATALPTSMAVDGAAADLSLSLIWTHLRTLTVQTNPALPPLECAGTFGYTCTGITSTGTFPEDRVSANARYASGNFDAHLGWRWIAGTDSGGAIDARDQGFPDPDLGIPSVGSKSYFDLGLGYQFSPSVSLRLNIANLLDTDPPLMGDAVTSNNTDDRYYDLFGRSYQVSLSLLL